MEHKEGEKFIITLKESYLSDDYEQAISCPIYYRFSGLNEVSLSGDIVDRLEKLTENENVILKSKSEEHALLSYEQGVEDGKAIQKVEDTKSSVKDGVERGRRQVLDIWRWYAEHELDEINDTFPTFSKLEDYPTFITFLEMNGVDYVLKRINNDEKSKHDVEQLTMAFKNMLESYKEKDLLTALENAGIEAKIKGEDE